MRTREEQIYQLACAIFNQHIDIDECITLARNYILEAERRAEQRVRAEIGRRVDKACETVMSLETPLMKGDNLAVTLCSHFEDCEGEADDNGWHPKAIEGYDQVKSAIGQHFRQAIDAAREVG
ncbi:MULTISPECIES: hypothetical protein [Acetobacter]|uniref:Uncharacterized protein n=2 Tax=Acetobacter TaxID=434 RepID=A0AAN1PJC0_9PROT|nr:MULTISPECIES: hypothetical protein [Acetobacter]ASL39282.1 hypothetical protein CBI36_01705 [Acetobacter oryzifermentans]AXN01409.1 hypothetical protein CJF59_13270 [Acetobacter pomorum]KAA8397199.1 hypothetical protein FKW22_05370 [Acetobacter sp. DmW_125124]KAA8397745.1 hypothetical protein FKW20_08800 [Acetobacter sp. DmW_125127]KAA8401148.1 hypothetical protein FKW19_00615 [Acetobacter sp. DmW_125128]